MPMLCWCQWHTLLQVPSYPHGLVGLKSEDAVNHGSVVAARVVLIVCSVLRLGNGWMLTS